MFIDKLKSILEENHCCKTVEKIRNLIKEENEARDKRCYDRQNAWKALGWSFLDKHGYRFEYDCNYQGTAVYKVIFDDIIRELFIPDGEDGFTSLFDELKSLPACRMMHHSEDSFIPFSYLLLPDVEQVRDLVERMKAKLEENKGKRCQLI